MGLMLKRRAWRLCALLLILAAVGGLCMAPAGAADSSARTVRVGYYSGSDSFQDGFSDDAFKTGYAYEYYQALASLAGWRYEYVYGTRTEVMELLASGEVDVVAGVYRTARLEKQFLFSDTDMGLDGEPRYFAVNPAQEDLWEELNRAQRALLASNPEFPLSLRQKYYIRSSQQVLTTAERAWLEEKGALNVGYVRYNLPISDQAEDGTPTGVVKELIAWVADYLNLPLNPVCYENASLMEEALRQGEIDAAFPVYSDLWTTEQKGFYQTDAVLSDRVMILYLGDYDSDLMDVIALSSTNVGLRYYFSTYYPDSELVFYASRADAYSSMLDGSATCMVGCSSVMQRFLASHQEYQDYNIAYLDTSEEFGIAVRQGDNVLLSALNKAVRQLDEASVTSAMVRYAGTERTITLSEILRRYAVAVIAVLAVFFAVLLGVFVAYRRRTNLYTREQARTRAALEDALAAANAASAAKTTFLSSMSHDIRTPMNGIIGMTAIAAAHLDEPDRVADCLKKITSSGKHLLALINEVLDMSKIESGEIDLSEETFELSALMDELITLNKPQCDAKGHEMIVHIQNLTHETVIGDTLRLQQIFTNLVSNAIKYTPDGGRIEITLSEKPSGSARLGCFVFSVEDNGVGIRADYLPHVFDAFTRADNSSANRVQGSGLGLAITRNIVRMMEGDITVESTPGKGSRFTATLFLKLPEQDSASYEDFVDLRILVVDDDPVICESSCILLSELGMRGESVLSGREAVELVAARHSAGMDYFALLIDWKMPEMDGVETTREIRRRVGSDVPIIIISAYDWSSIEKEALASGANGFIGKPLFKSRLVHAFGKLLGKEADEGSRGLRELTAQTDFSGKRALLAEDNDINAEIAMEILDMTGLAVDWAHDGKEALDRFAASAPGWYDCVFMDVQMPGMNGLDAARAIRALPRDDARSVPIFAMTANTFADDVRAALDAGMNEHIAKPLDLDLLLSVLRRYLGREGDGAQTGSHAG